MKKDAKIVRETYEQLGSKFDCWAESVRTRERVKYLKKIKERLQPGSRLLDVGCGNGALEALELSSGFDVVGVDVSERQIKEARKNVPDAEFLCGDVREFVFSPESFDAVVSFYCFNHIARDSYRDLLRRLHRWLKPKGVLICSFGIGDTDEWVGDWLGVKTHFSSYDRESTLSIVRDAGFIVEEENIETDWEDGEETSFLWVVAMKAAKSRIGGGVCHA